MSWIRDSFNFWLQFFPVWQHIWKMPSNKLHTEITHYSEKHYSELLSWVTVPNTKYPLYIKVIILFIKLCGSYSPELYELFTSKQLLPSQENYSIENWRGKSFFFQKESLGFTPYPDNDNVYTLHNILIFSLLLFTILELLSRFGEKHKQNPSEKYYLYKCL